MAGFDPDAPAGEGSGVFGLDVEESKAEVVLLPVPFEATVSYGKGTSRGPELILGASHQIDLFDLETGHPYRAGIHMRPLPKEILALLEVEGVEAINRASAQMNRYTFEEASALLCASKIVGVVGGDHSVALGSIKAHAEHFGSLGVLQFDAHADLRVAYEGFTWSHASVMERALEEVPQLTRLIQVGVRDLGTAEFERTQTDDRVTTFFDPELQKARLLGQLSSVFERIVSALPERVYVSFDIDGLDPKLCPGTGTPVPGGLDFYEASILLGMVAEAKTIVGFDLTEVAGSEWDGNVGARVLYKLIGYCLKSRMDRSADAV